jgi:hypothetical protein
MARPIIPPFPTDVNRNEFGHWLSGFTDAEAMFFLTAPPVRDPSKYCCRANFDIVLRDDDAEVLHLIQSFLQCGSIYYRTNQRSKITNAKPIVIYHVGNVFDHFGTVIPHFEKYPLRAKKRNDFIIWRRGVELIASVKRRRTKGRPCFAKGIQPRWTESEWQQFCSISAKLRDQRKYPTNDTKDCPVSDPSPDAHPRSNGHRRDDEFTLPGFSDPD